MNNIQCAPTIVGHNLAQTQNKMLPRELEMTKKGLKTLKFDAFDVNQDPYTRLSALVPVQGFWLNLESTIDKSRSIKSC